METEAVERTRGRKLAVGGIGCFSEVRLGEHEYSFVQNIRAPHGGSNLEMLGIFSTRLYLCGRHTGQPGYGWLDEVYLEYC